MWQELEVSMMATSFDCVYDNNIVTRYVQDLVREGVAEVVLEEGLVIPAYESMQVVEGLCTECFFERAVYDAAVHGYEVNKVHVLVEVKALRRLSLGIRQRLFRRRVNVGERVFMLWLNHALIEIVRCLHDPAEIKDRAIIIGRLYPVMIVRAIMQFVARGFDNIVRKNNNLDLLSDRFGVNLEIIVSHTEHVLHWCEYAFGFIDELREVRAAWDAARGFVTRISEVVGPARRVDGDPICVFCLEHLFVENARRIGALNCGHVMHEGCANDYRTNRGGRRISMPVCAHSSAGIRTLYFQ
jgi:hypothetical protein